MWRVDTMTKRNLLLAFGLALISIVVAGYGVFRYATPASKFYSLQFLPVPKPLIDFTLENQHGDRVAAVDFKGPWSLVFFGFTSCPDMCPLGLQELAKVLRMAKQQKQIQVQGVFISLDPERDSAQKIADYLAAFHLSMLGLRGVHSELAALNTFFNIDYSRNLTLEGAPLTIPTGIDIPPAMPRDYQIEHSGRIFLINPEGQYLGSFAQPYSADNIWADLQLIIKR